MSCLTNTLKEIAASAISTADEINNTIHVIVDYRVGICVSVLISAVLLTRCCPMVLRRLVFNLCNALNDRSAERDVVGIIARIFVPH